MATTTDRPLRLCDVCGGLDDHPRHVQSVGKDGNGTPSDEDLVRLTDGRDVPIGALVQLLNPQVQVRHMDCCAAQGCPICAETERENGERRGQALIDHLDSTRGND